MSTMTTAIDLEKLPNLPAADQLRKLVSWLQVNRPPMITHPLGFLQTKWCENGVEHRLNLWISELSQPKVPHWPIHDHAYGFTSKVLVGALSEIRYDVVVGGRTWRVFDVEYNKQGSSLNQRADLVDLKEVSRSRYDAGECYRIEIGEIHCTELAAKMAVSLMKLETRCEPRQPRVFGDTEAPVPSYEAKPVDIDAVRGAIARL